MEKKKTVFDEVTIYRRANGYSLLFKEYRGEYPGEDKFVAKNLDEVKKICTENLRKINL